jgi:hypothetical protein
MYIATCVNGMTPQAELDADRAAADQNHALRGVGQRGLLAVGPDRHLVHAGDRRDERLGAGRHDDVLRVQDLAVHLDRAPAP